MQLVDLSQTIGPDTPLFSPDWPRPTCTPYLSHAQSAFSGRYLGTTVELSFAQLITSVGTYLDSPFHFNPEGPTVERLDLSQLVLPGLVVPCAGRAPRAPLGPDVVAGLDLAGRAVLLHTGWSAYWGLAAYAEHPFITGELAQALREGGAKLVGCDFMLADDPNDPRRPAHVTLLNAGVLIVENLTRLDQIPPGSFTFHAVPPKLAGAAAFPVRAYALVL
ncbi:MAG TPA: cyclase family protein [Chloroflexaceae bacterium]|nr:cyclase family protein [Chloroflexaceae bacterium]